MAHGNTAVLGRIALRRVPACALPSSVRAAPALVMDATSRPAATAEGADPARAVLQAVMAYLADA